MEKVVTAQKTTLLITNNKVNRPEATLTFIVVRFCGIDIAKVAPPVNNKLMPPKIVTNNRMSSQRHQL